METHSQTDTSRGNTSWYIYGMGISGTPKNINGSALQRVLVLTRRSLREREREVETEGAAKCAGGAKKGRERKEGMKESAMPANGYGLRGT